MSGGVDSSVVAGILKREGYDVVGVTLQLYDQGAANHRAGSCCAGRDIDDARRVCETLGIPHYVLDYEERFRKAVIDPFAESYVAGRDADPLRLLQPDGQVRRSARHRARSRRRTHSPPATISAAGRTARTGRSSVPSTATATRATSCSPPRRSRSTICAFRSAACRSRRSAPSPPSSAWRSPTSRTARTSASCRRARYSDIIAKLKPAAAHRRATSSISTAACSAATRASCTTRSASAAASASPPASRSTSSISTPPRARLIVGPREALDTHKIYLRDLNWLGDADVDGCRRGRHRAVRQGALDAPAAPGDPASPRRRDLGGTGRRRVRRRARPGLRPL